MLENNIKFQKKIIIFFCFAHIKKENRAASGRERRQPGFGIVAFVPGLWRGRRGFAAPSPTRSERSVSG